MTQHVYDRLPCKPGCACHRCMVLVQGIEGRRCHITWPKVKYTGMGSADYICPRSDIQPSSCMLIKCSVSFIAQQAVRYNTTNNTAQYQG
ncbi:hypothetical protein T4E_3113 [Trichinella pseudospiralis]|uniref:Uncharacterized protein n=1 Tax=Trichinella pseudospiralis TaxID=6337 RepID=A0A0V0XJY8_TRIPS|nr:hypothetical protein T4E_3113 [Trichinella pseudospiralis]